MLFNSISFLIFATTVFGLYWFGCGRNVKAQNLLLITASAVFYGWWDWRFLGLIAVTCFLTYGAGIFEAQRLDRGKPPSKTIVVLSLAVNLGILVFFKYCNFFIDSAANLLDALGFAADFPTLHIILPVGISFYTFMALSYTIDVYEGKIKPERDPILFFAYITFFPQLLAGPIGRAPEMLPQFRLPRVFDNALAVDGCRQFLWGLFKKVVIADECAILTDRLFGSYGEFPGSMLLLGAFMYAIQIYCDFSGYSDMAIGTGKVFGIRLRQNFACPYFATNIGDFWRRWHMSLTTWFRDYVYIPLGGSHCNLGRVVFNTWVVFLLSGLWHGAAWNFVIWGAVHAALLSFFVLWKRTGLKLPAFLGWLVTMPFVMLAWVFFRAASCDAACGYLGRMFSSSLLTLPRQYLSMMPWIACFLAVEWLQRKKEHALRLPFRSRPLRWAIYLVVAAICLAYQKRTGNFIYFQF
jgi:alginate O-acetyltransferase complex protein AlgI